MEKGNRMDKREIAAKITQKKEEIKNLIAQDNLEDAKKARKEMKDLQEKYDLLDEMELILSILVDTFISKISLTMQPGPKIDSISGA